MYDLMIVDDSNVIRNRIERSMNGLDLNVVATAGNGEEAVAQFNKYQPQFVTMDLTMPQMDGLACIRALKAINPNVNILVVSALSDRKTGLRALQYGARGFICKPFTDEQLLASLEKMVDNFHASQTN